jgi:hypothetical protein
MSRHTQDSFLCLALLMRRLHSIGNRLFNMQAKSESVGVFSDRPCGQISLESR